MGLGAGQEPNEQDFVDIVEKPMCSLYDATPGTASSNVLFTVSMEGEYYDYGGLHSTTTNSARITPTRAGIWKFWGAIGYPPRTDWQIVYAYIRVNGNINLAPPGRQSFPSGAQVNNSFILPVLPCYYAMNGVTDYVELAGIGQNAAAAAFTLMGSGNIVSTLSAEWVRPA